MRMAIFFGLMTIADAVYKLAGTTKLFDDGVVKILSAVFVVCLIQDIVWLFKRGE